MASIRKRVTADGKVKWHAQIRLLGFDPLTKTFDRKFDAETWAAETERALRTSSFNTARESQRRTVAHLFEVFRRDYMRDTRKRDYTQILAWWEKRLGHLFLANLKATSIQKVIDEFAKEPLPSSKAPTQGGGAVAREGTKEDAEPRFRTASTLARYLAVLSRVLSVAVKNLEWLDRSPMAGVKRPGAGIIRIVRILSAQEEKSLLDAVRGSESLTLHPFVLIALRSGMRYSEIKNLRWGDIDFRENHALIAIRKAKNKRQRFVPLVRDGFDAVARMRAGIGEPGASALLFPSSDDAERPVDIRRAWKTSVRRAGIAKFRFHDLRHSAASTLAALGASLPEIADILGHTDHRSTQIYTHFEKSHSVKLAQRAADSRLSQVEALQDDTPPPTAPA